MHNVTIEHIEEAKETLSDVVVHTPLQLNRHLSEYYQAKIYLKREDLQDVRSFKIRGAFNKISSLRDEEKRRGVVCASAGNHAQGVAYSCNRLKIKGAIFMPEITPNQKIRKVRMFGGSYVDVILTGQSFDEAYAASRSYEQEQGAVYVHPFNDPAVIAGQGTVGQEIYETLNGKLDAVVVCVGGGGLISGIATYLKQKDASITVYGSEPAGAAEMAASVNAGKLVTLDKIDTFIDGASLRTTGELTLNICQRYVDRFIAVPEGKVCKTMIDLYQDEGIVAEPAGSLAVAALDDVANDIRGKTVVCTLSGGNNDIMRYPEVMERSLVWQGLKHYFIINFAQKPGQLRKFLDQALGRNDDIVRFEYVKKTNKETGPALVGIELQSREDLQPFVERLDALGFDYRCITADDMLYNHLI